MLFYHLCLSHLNVLLYCLRCDITVGSIKQVLSLYQKLLVCMYFFPLMFVSPD